MKTMLKKLSVTIMAAATLTVGMIGMNANAAGTYKFGDPNYGGNYYSLDVDNCTSTGNFYSHSTMTRHCTIELYLYNPNTRQTLSGSQKPASSDVESETWLTVSKNYNGHNSAYKHYYKANLYGGTVGSVPIVETVVLNLGC